MLQLILAAVFFVGIHFGLAGSGFRQTLVERLGEKGFRAGFSILSLLGLAWLIHAYRAAPYVETWGQLAWFKPVAALLMPVAFMLVVTGLSLRGPTVVGGEGALHRPEVAQGILRVTRHPFLWGLALWALLHLLANGDVAALILFGSLLLLCLGGTASIDRKRRRSLGERWEKFAAVTSNVPFQAIREGRNHLKPAEIGWQRLIVALLLYLLVMHFHAELFGVSPLF